MAGVVTFFRDHFSWFVAVYFASVLALAWFGYDFGSRLAAEWGRSRRAQRVAGLAGGPVASVTLHSVHFIAVILYSAEMGVAGLAQTALGLSALGVTASSLVGAAAWMIERRSRGGRGAR